MLKTNEKSLVKMAVQGTVATTLRYDDFEMDQHGQGHTVPSVGGITYNVKVGDPAFGWQGDHIEPAVSTILNADKRRDKPNRAYNFLACCGNEAIVISGDAKGHKGVVTGHHGGVEHVVIDFPDRTLNKLTMDDKFLIRTFGQGLALTDYPDVKVYNLDPMLLKMKQFISEKKGKLEVPVSAIVPAALMGSGLGAPDPASGDYDITTQDTGMLKKHKLDKIKLGDFVAIQDADNTFGRHYLTGAMTIGLVVHSDSILSGHGPGVVTLLSNRKSTIVPKISKTANIANLLKIGRKRGK
jgi:hypothetical protein